MDFGTFASQFRLQVVPVNRLVLNLRVESRESSSLCNPQHVISKSFLANIGAELRDTDDVREGEDEELVPVEDSDAPGHRKSRSSNAWCEDE